MNGFTEPSAATSLGQASRPGARGLDRPVSPKRHQLFRNDRSTLRIGGLIGGSRWLPGQPPGATDQATDHAPTAHIGIVGWLIEGVVS